MKNFFTFRQRPSELFTPTSRGLNGGRTGVERTVKGRSVVHRALCIVNLLIALCFGFSSQAWADDTWTTIYYAVDASTVGCYTVKINANIGDNNSWRSSEMTKTGFTYNGKIIYTGQVNEKYGGIDVLQIQLYEGSNWKSQEQPYSSYTPSSNYSGKMYVHGTGWVNYSTDASYTLYYVNTNGWNDVYAYAWNSDCDNNWSWRGIQMTKTDKTYNGKDIYSLEFTKRFTKVIFNGAESNKQTGDLDCYSNTGKLYDGTNWQNYNYDVTLTFKNGSTTVATETVLKGGNITAPAAPSKTGYTFQGWGTDKVAAGATISNVQADATYEAQWSPITYTVAYAGNDNTGGSTASSTHTYDVAKNLTANGFTREYVVTYEYDDATGGNSDESATATYTFAHWTCSANANTYSNGASVTNLTSTQDATVTMTAQWNSGSVTLPTPTKTGYNFSGWYNEGTKVGDGGASFTPTADITLTAHWTAKQTTITLDKNEGDTDGTPTQITATYGQLLPAQLESFTAPVKDGYNFKGYFSETSGGTQYYNYQGARVYDGNWANEDATATFYAQWENAATYSLTVNVTPSAAFTAHSENVDNITLGQSYNISATLADKGYTWTGWTYSGDGIASFADASALSTTVTVSNGSVIVTANAQAKTYTLTLNGNEGHVENTDPEQTSADVTVTYNEGCPAIPTFVRTGYDYSGFAVGTGSSSAKIILKENTFTTSTQSTQSKWVTDAKWTKDGDGTLYACWTAHYKTLTLNKHYTQSAMAGYGADGSGKITVGTKTAENYTAATRSGYTLLGYSIDENGTIMVMDKDGNFIPNVSGYTDSEGNWIQDITNGTIDKLYAQWQEVLTKVALSANPAGAGTIRISNEISTEASVGITTRPAVSAYPLNADWTFSSWTPSNCSVVGGKLVGNGTSETGSLVANFTLTECKLRWSITSSDFHNPDKDEIMSYDTNEKAYYYDIVTTGSPLYFRFMIGTTEYSVDWLNGKYEDGRKEVTVGGARVDCDKEVQTWDKRATAKFTGATGSTIRIWFDQINKRTWITEPTHTVIILDSEYGTINPKGAKQVGQIQGLAISATVSNESYGFYFSGWTADKAGITFADASAKSTTVYASEDGTVTPNYASRYALRGSLSTSDDPHGMPGWSDDTQTFNFVKGQKTATYQATLERYQTYKLKVKDLGNEGKSYGASGSITENVGKKLESSNDNAPTFTTTVAGTYTFTLDVNSGGTTPTISIAYPASVTATYSISATDATAAANAPTAVSEMVTIESGTRVTKDNSITFTAQPAKTGYTFSGWFDNAAGTGTALTTELDYTTTASEDITIYAVYAETMSAVTINAPLSTEGSIDVIGEKSLGITTSQQIVATAVAGYYFKEWQVTGSALVTDAHSATTKVYTNGSGEIGNVTAVFEFRWVLRGSRVDSEDTEGMPGWNTTTDYFEFEAGQEVGKEMGTINVTLLPNRQYKFMVYDKKLDKQCGYSEVTHLGASKWSNLLINENAFHLTMWSAGHGVYTFKVEENIDHSKARVYISNAASECITMGTKSVTEGCGTELDGGTITAEDDEHYTITSGQYVRNGGAVTFTAHPKTGYNFSGFYNDAECNTKLSDVNPYTISDIKSDKTVYAKFSEILKEVTVIQSDGSQSTVNVGVASHPEITADAVSGKKFTGWSTNHVTVANANSKTTTITGYSDGYNVYSVTATFGAKDVIYLYNKISGTWNPSEMYVYFYKGAYPNFDDSGAGSQWNGENTWAPTCMMKKGIPMTKIEGTHIWKAEYDKDDNEYFAYSSEDIKLVVFNDHEQNLYDRFENCSLVYTDFVSCMNMFVLTDATYYKKNETALYYNKDDGAFWMNYEAPSSGLYVHVHDGGTEINNVELNHPEGDGWYSASVHLNVESNLESYNYYFYLGSCNGKDFSLTETTVTSTSEPITLYVYDDLANKVVLSASATGSYKFFAKHNDADNTVTVRVEYPVYENDYRVVSVIDDEVHDNGYLYKSSTTEDEMASFYVVNGAKVKLQKCTAITGTTVTWSDVDGQSITITGLTKPSVYNFKITHNGADATLSQVGAYTGDFYIRTDKLNGGWTDYATNSDNLLTKYGKMVDAGDNYQFNYFQTKFISGGSNVKCVVANDYSKCISDTLTTDAIIDNIETDDVQEQTLPQEANVRFMWNSETNQLKRAYLSGSNDSHYLVLLGNKDNEEQSLMLDLEESSFPNDEAIFTDLGNWVYQLDIKAKPGCAVKLTAKYGDHVQYFIGAEDDDTNSRKKIMDGTGTTAYRMRTVYDFKNNQLVAGWLPDNETTIETEIKLGGDMLLVRNEQSTASQIKFGTAADAKVSSIQQIYGVLELSKQDMTNRTDNNGQRIPLTNKSYDRCLYWISFPFRVQISKVFGGVGHYGTKWIMQKYRGDLRAQKGWFAETATFWEYMSEDEYLEPYVGYVLCLDPDYFDEVSDEVWQNVDENVAFYFPSEDTDINIISSASQTVTVPSHECKIERTFTVDDKVLSHKETDSHWNVIGIPAFEDLTEDIGDGKHIGLKALYEWVAESNTYTPIATATGYTFNAMKAYMVQFEGKIVWSNASVVQKSVSKSVAPPRRLEETANYMAEIEFHQGNKANDHTYINLADNATTDFLLNEDMMKIDNAGCPNIYSFAGNYNVAYNETSKASQIVDLGVSAPAAGNYKFHMPSEFTGTVTLIDNVEQTRTNLQVQDYELYLDKGTYNDRFQLEINLQSVVTNLDNVFGGQLNSDHAVKFIRDDKMFILRSGNIFDATGKKVK